MRFAGIAAFFAAVMPGLIASPVALAQHYPAKAVRVFAPAGTPRAIIDRVNAEIKNALESPDMKSRLAAFEPWYMTPEQTAARIKSDYEKYGYLIKLTGTKVE